jgi:predicted anti-sigma-YlaC factor YlaD
MILALELAFAAVSAAADRVTGERVEPGGLPHLPVLLTFAVLVTVLTTTKGLELALTRRRSRAEPVEAPTPPPPPNRNRSVQRRYPTSAHERTGKQEEAGATAPNGGFE